MIDLSKIETYNPEAEEVQFLMDNYSDFESCRELKLEGQDILGGLTLQDFWDRSNYDYNVLVDEADLNDPVTQYSSPISRDKSNAFISSLTNQLIIPSTTAQNQEQEIDHVISKVSKSVLYWAHMNDGRPFSSGHKKTVDYVHKMVIEGTVHVQDDVIDGELVSQLVPNEEIFIPNFWQRDIQLQPYLFRVQEQVHYNEAERQFGELDNFKYVMPGRMSSWTKDQNVEFKSFDEGIDSDEEVQIIYIWRDIPKHKFKEYKVPKGRKKAKLFNIMINGVLMFPVNNLMPYRDGFYPISKEIFERFSKSEYYWGNSMPNKAHNDKKFLDGWKTLIRHKAKLEAIPPLVTYNGRFVDTDIFIPGNVTQLPAGMKPEDLDVVPGINTRGVNNSDLAVLQDAKQEIDEGNLSPQASGKSAKGAQTATEAIILEQNEQKILGAFGLQIAFLIEQRTFPILMRLYQFLPKSRLKKLAIPEQSIGQGKIGTLEVIFEKLPEMTKEQKIKVSASILEVEREAEKVGRPKKIVFVNPEYVSNLSYYVQAVAEVKPRSSDAIMRAEAREKFGIYASRPDLFNPKAAARNLVRANGDDESDLLPQAEKEIPMPMDLEKSEGEKSLQGAVSANKAAMTEMTSPPKRTL